MKRISLYIWLCLSMISIAATGRDKKQTIRVMSFNIRMDTEEDGFNRWSNRKDYACDMIRFHHPDLIGAQEVLHHQLQDMCQRLPEYEAVGVGREDGKEKGEYSAVFFRKDRFRLLQQQTFWLSENPEAVGVKGWDAACERVVTWVKLRDRKSKKTFYFFNTHFDHMGEIARRESCKLLKNKIREIAGDAPVIVSGDFNASPASGVILALTDTADPDYLVNSRSVAAFRYGPEFSFHDYGKLPLERRTILDYIFVKQIDRVLQSAILTDTRGELFVSDHYPLLSVIKL